MTLTVSRRRASLVLAIFVMAHSAAAIGHVHLHTPCGDAAHASACGHHSAHDHGQEPLGHEHAPAKTPAETMPAPGDNCVVCQFLANTAVPPMAMAVVERLEPLAEQVPVEPFFLSHPTAREYHSRAPPRLA